MRDLISFNNKNPLMKRRDGIEDFYDLMDDFFKRPLSTGRNFMEDSFKLDVKDEGEKYLIEADLPGVDKDEVNLELDDGRLTISIEREEEEDVEEENYVHRERRYSSMKRSIYLGDIDQEGINAKLEDGVLCIEIPKDEEREEVKKIPVE